jgi:hypothetical protein
LGYCRHAEMRPWKIVGALMIRSWVRGDIDVIMLVIWLKDERNGVFASLSDVGCSRHRLGSTRQYQQNAGAGYQHTRLGTTRDKTRWNDSGN